MNHIEAMKQALEALDCLPWQASPIAVEATKALRTALAQTEQEPEWIEDGFGTMWQKCGEKNCGRFVVKIGKVDCWNGDCPEEKNT